jgi:hypothetical protein
MSTKLKHKQQEASPGQNVVAMPSKCSAESCGKKSELMNFCNEHYDWFKFGLITKEGKRPSDFDKKFQAYKKRHAA